MRNKFLPIKRVLCSALLILLMAAAGKVNAQINTPASFTSDANNAKTVGVIPYSEDFTTYEEVVERNYAITSFRMLDTATVAVLTGASDIILVYSLTDNQILHKIKLPISARAFDYDNGVFHVIGDRTYLSMDQEGFIHERKDFQQPNKEIFIITDLKTIDGQPIIHECEANTYSIASDGLQEIDTFYYHHARGCKIHPKYNDESSFTLYNETSSQRGNINVTMESLGLEGKLSCLDEISVDDDFIAINLQTTYNHTGNFVKSYLLVVNHNGELINLVEVPINFLSYISKPFLYKDNAWYYAFSGQEGISFFKIDTNTNKVDTPDPSILTDENIDYFYREPENGTSGEDINNDSTRGNWRTITQAWYNANQYCTLDWTPISSNVATSCTWVGGSGYIKTPITSYGYTETGVPYKWGGYTSWRNFESLASQGKYTGNRVTTSSTCGGNAYSSDADTYVVGVDCSGYVSRCWEVAHKTTSSIPNICTSQGLVTSASSSAFQNMDALNKSGNHVMLYRAHNGSNQVIVFESSANDWKTSGRTYNISYFSGYYIQRLNYMKYIILRLNSAITLSQNGSTVTNVTQGQPLTVNYSVKNFGSETWTGYVSLWIKQSNGTLMCIQGESQNGLTTLNAGGSASFTFSNNGVSSPVGETRFYVKVTNYSASDFGEPYDVGEGGYANPKVFQIVPNPGGGTGNCSSCPDYDETWTVSGNGDWYTRSSSIASGGCYIYRVRLISNYTYTFQTGCNHGTATFDTELYLYDASCNQVAYNDDGCSNHLSSLEYTNTGSSAYYYLKVKGYDDDEAGSFTIAGMREIPSICKDCPDYDETWTVSGDGNWYTRSASIASGGCYIYKVQLLSGYTYTFQTGCDHGNADFDTELYLFDASCNQVAYNDDGCSNHLSSLEYTNTGSNAYYYLRVNGYDDDEAGAFTVAAMRQSPVVNYVIDVSASPSSGGTVGGSGTYQSGSTCTLTASPNTGYSFVRWKKNGSQVSTNATYSFIVTENASYVAEFSQNSYTVSASANPSNGGSVSGGGSYNYGSSCTLTATPATGYSFVRWTKNGSQVSTNATYSFTVTESASYVAVFSQNSYTISASANPSAGGTVSGGGTYNHGSSCTLTATPATGYSFVRWTKNGSQVSTNATYSFTVTESASYVAEFSQNGYTISVSANPSAGGTITGGGTYQQGQTCSLTATANTGYTFTNWTESGTVVSTNATYSFTVTGNRTLVANFEEQGQITNHWTPEGANYSETMALYCVIQIDGVEQYSNMLEVGAFCDNECRGSAIASEFNLTHRYLAIMNVFGENGHQLTFKLYDHSIGQELNLTSPPTVTFNTNGYGNPIEPYVLNFTSSVTHSQALSSGWNWWSTYIEQDGIDGLGMLENSLGSAGLRIQGRNGTIDQFDYQGSSYWYGSLTSIENEQMYKIRTNAACNAMMVGNMALFANHPITINGGWNWIGFPSSQNVSVGVAMSGFTPEANDVIKSRNGSTTYVSYGSSSLWYGTLNTLEPGQGYMYKSNSNTSKTLVFQMGRGEETVTNATEENSFFTPNTDDFSDNMLVTAVIDMEGQELRSGDYELAAFVGNECRGSVKLMYVEPLDRYIAFLLVFGEAGEEIHFVLTDGIDMAWSEDQMTYTADGLEGTVTEPAILHFGTLGLNEGEQVIVNIFPNPSNGVFNIESNGIRKIEVINTFGQIILSEEIKDSHVQIDLSGKAIGMYLLRVITNNGITTKQLIKE